MPEKSFPFSSRGMNMLSLFVKYALVGGMGFVIGFFLWHGNFIQFSGAADVCDNDTTLDAGETCSNCPYDVRCTSAQKCIAGVCDGTNWACMREDICGDGWLSSFEVCEDGGICTGSTNASFNLQSCYDLDPARNRLAGVARCRSAGGICVAKDNDGCSRDCQWKCHVGGDPCLLNSDCCSNVCTDGVCVGGTGGEAICGNNIIETGETCDDRNTISGDGCSSTCQATTQCNDGLDNLDAEDAFVDTNDTGCHTDSIAANAASYDPTDNNETSECSDSVDNDDTEDTFIDVNDPGCMLSSGFGFPIWHPSFYNPTDNDESHVIVCGNLAIEPGETCDDMNTIPGDGCSSTCQITKQCNDGVDNIDPEDILVDTNDPGCHTDSIAANAASYDPTDNDETPECSNGYNDDSPEDSLVDTYDPDCHIDGVAWNPASYDPTDNKEKHVIVCGDAITETGETCDDGNTIPGDGCSSTCQITMQCNDGVDNSDPEDALADINDPDCHTDANAGNAASYDPSDPSETNVPICGNAITETGETCDDGNTIYGDGCWDCQMTIECSDRVNNDDLEDALVDTNDPGCHTDGNAGNAASYDGWDNDETNVLGGCGNGIADSGEMCGEPTLSCQVPGYQACTSCQCIDPPPCCQTPLPHTFNVAVSNFMFCNELNGMTFNASWDPVAGGWVGTHSYVANSENWTMTLTLFDQCLKVLSTPDPKWATQIKCAGPTTNTYNYDAQQLLCTPRYVIDAHNIVVGQNCGCTASSGEFWVMWEQ